MVPSSVNYTETEYIHEHAVTAARFGLAPSTLQQRRRALEKARAAGQAQPGDPLPGLHFWRSSPGRCGRTFWSIFWLRAWLSEPPETHARRIALALAEREKSLAARGPGRPAKQAQP